MAYAAHMNISTYLIEWLIISIWKIGMLVQIRRILRLDGTIMKRSEDVLWSHISIHDLRPHGPCSSSDNNMALFFTWIWLMTVCWWFVNAECTPSSVSFTCGWKLDERLLCATCCTTWFLRNTANAMMTSLYGHTFRIIVPFVRVIYQLPIYYALFLGHSHMQCGVMFKPKIRI